MAHEQHQGFKHAFIAASTVARKVPVLLDTTQGQVVPLASPAQRPVGVTIASAAQGKPVAVYGIGNTVKAIANASVGFGALVGIASTNGSLGPVAAASGVTVWAVGEARENAAAGETFSVFVNPRPLDAQI